MPTTITFQEFLLSLFGLVVTTAVTFFLKDRFQRFLDYRKLKTKLDSVAGRRATILFAGRKYQIESFDRQGLVLSSKLDTVFMPLEEALKHIVIVPSTDYDKELERQEQEQREKLKRQIIDNMNTMMDEIFPKLAENMRTLILDELGEEKTEMSIAIGMKITKFLEEEGIQMKQTSKQLQHSPENQHGNKKAGE